MWVIDILFNYLGGFGNGLSREEREERFSTIAGLDINY